MKNMLQIVLGCAALALFPSLGNAAPVNTSGQACISQSGVSYTDYGAELTDATKTIYCPAVNWTTNAGSVTGSVTYFKPNTGPTSCVLYGVVGGGINPSYSTAVNLTVVNAPATATFGFFNNVPFTNLAIKCGGSGSQYLTIYGYTITTP